MRSVQRACWIQYVGGHPDGGHRALRLVCRRPDDACRAPWVVSADDHVDPDVWSQVAALALDSGAFVVPASRTSTMRQRRQHRTFRTWWPRRSRSPRARCHWPSPGGAARSGTAHGLPEPPPTWCVPCVRGERRSTCPRTRPRTGIAESGAAIAGLTRSPWPTWSKRATPPTFTTIFAPGDRDHLRSRRTGVTNARSGGSGAVSSDLPASPGVVEG